MSKTSAPERIITIDCAICKKAQKFALIGPQKDQRGNTLYLLYACAQCGGSKGIQT